MENFPSIYYLFMAVLGRSDFQFLFNFNLVGSQKRFFNEKDRLNYNMTYSGENYSRKDFFPAYSKSSKMALGNRYGRHINLERRLKGGTGKWK